MKEIKEIAENLGIHILIILIILLTARVLLSVISSITRKVISRSKGEPKEKQITTTMSVFRSASRYGIYFLAAILIISVIGGTDANNALVTAGIGTVILTLGAQSLFADIISGLLLVFDRQYEVGDFVKIADYEGTVKAISIRATYLELGGRKIIIPNSQVKDVVNYTEYVACIVNVPTGYTADHKLIKKTLEQICTDYYNEHGDMVLDKPTLLGIDEFASSSIDYKIYCKCYPIKHYSVPRQIKEMIKTRFDELNIEIPFSQLDVHIKKDE